MQSTKAKVESYPAPRQLATKTDLSPQEVKAVTEAVNPLIADAFALYVKTKNFHWHPYGSHFRDYHLLLDEHADAIFDQHQWAWSNVNGLSFPEIQFTGFPGKHLAKLRVYARRCKTA